MDPISLTSASFAVLYAVAMILIADALSDSRSRGVPARAIGPVAPMGQVRPRRSTELTILPHAILQARGPQAQSVGNDADRR